MDILYRAADIIGFEPMHILNFFICAFAVIIILVALMLISGILTGLRSKTWSPNEWLKNAYAGIFANSKPIVIFLVALVCFIGAWATGIDDARHYYGLVEDENTIYCEPYEAIIYVNTHTNFQKDSAMRAVVYVERYKDDWRIGEVILPYAKSVIVGENYSEDFELNKKYDIEIRAHNHVGGTQIMFLSKAGEHAESAMRYTGCQFSIWVGSNTSDKYHYPDCPYVENIIDTSRIWFSSELEAAIFGYDMCATCAKR